VEGVVCAAAGEAWVEEGRRGAGSEAHRPLTISTLACPVLLSAPPPLLLALAPTCSTCPPSVNHHHALPAVPCSYTHQPSSDNTTSPPPTHTHTHPTHPQLASGDLGPAIVDHRTREALVKAGLRNQAAAAAAAGGGDKGGGGGSGKGGGKASGRHASKRGRAH
jgi:hypothetical protein